MPVVCEGGAADDSLLPLDIKGLSVIRSLNYSSKNCLSLRSAYL